MTGDDDLQGLSSARADVLAKLRALDHPVTVAQLADVLGQHRNTVRGKLDALVASRLVTAEPEPPTGQRGRPAMLYRVSSGVFAGQQEYSELALLLARQLASTADAAQVAEELGVVWAADLLARARAEGVQPSPPVELLREMGFQPELLLDGHTVVLRRCPLAEAATAEPDVVCAMHSRMVRSVLAGNGVEATVSQDQPILAPGICQLVVRSAPIPAG